MPSLQHLEELLREHRPSDRRELGFRDRMLALVAEGQSALRRDRFQPGHFTASAFVLSPDAGSLLLILHAKLGLWLQPGGHLEPDDADILAAARREAREEVGLDGLELVEPSIFDVDIHDIPAGRDPAHQHFDVRFLFRARERALRAASDARAARWVPLGEVEQMHSDASVMRAVSRLRARLG